MPWWSWLLLGVVAGVVLFIAACLAVDVIDDRHAARVRRLNARQLASERQLVTAVHDTIERLFVEARQSLSPGDRRGSL